MKRCWMGALVVLLASGLAAQGMASLTDARPLGVWDFDETAGGDCADSSGNGCNASLEGAQTGAIGRAEGVFGNAVSLSGAHKLMAPEKPDFSGLSQITLVAWVLPSDLGGFREIFRKEDGEQRVLFSFQGDGHILSLGLNIQGYLECDAAIQPEAILDGQWHLCAGTFDGQFMRVYVDGEEMGSLQRTGPILAGGKAPGCIGSSNGGECFQGLIDDLRIYANCLSLEDIRSLHQEGAQVLARAASEAEARLASFYATEESFSKTLMGCKKRLFEAGVQPDRTLAHAIIARLRSEFPEEYRDYATWTGSSPLEALTSQEGDALRAQAERTVELLMEYQPTTDEQRQQLDPESLRKWEDAERIQQKLEALQSQGESGRFAPDWIDILLEAGPRVCLRPSVQEAVAPYVKPETPETRTLSPTEARQGLERDWIHQANDTPTRDRILKEIQWSRDLARRIADSANPPVDFDTDLADLRDLERRARTLIAPDQELYFKVRAIKRRIAFKNPVLDFDQVLFVDMPFPAGSEWPHETRHRLGYMAVPGGRLLSLKGLGPEGDLFQIMPQPGTHGSFWRPDVSYDAQRVLVCFKPSNEKSFHLYEINVDGSGLTQLTQGPYDDLDPIYLPDDQHLVFSTTRGHTYVRCMPPTNAYVLARCDRDGHNIYLISSNNEPDYLASMMEDGRIIYTRWEYTDKPLWRAQGLWTVNPDGTQVNTFWGNQSVWPDLLKDVRCIPGSRRVMFTGSAHHNWFSGSVGIIDPDLGYNFPEGLFKVTADVTWPESGNGPIDPVESPSYHASGEYPAYTSPYPLSEQDFLVSAERHGKFLLYFMDVDGNRELIYEGTQNIFHAIPIRPRTKPPVIEDRVVWPSKEQRLDPKPGVLFSGNVYQGAPPELSGKCKYLRILNIEAKTYTYWHQRPYISTGPVVSMVQSDGVKRVLGTVPIEEDGSVAFVAPSGIALHFQILDERQRALQTMRSFVGVMPGERRGCLGCHPSHSRAPVTQKGSRALARPAQEITPLPWGQDSVSFPRYVQPVLDRHCGKCHEGEGKARKKVDFTLRPGFLMFQEPYVLLTGSPSWGAPYKPPDPPPPGWGIADTIMVEGYSTTDPEAYVTPRPMTRLSYRSRLIEIASSGKHHGVKVDEEDLLRLILWVDTLCPYFGSEEIRQIPNPVFQGVDWLAIRPLIASAPTLVRPGPVD